MLFVVVPISRQLLLFSPWCEFPYILLIYRIKIRLYLYFSN
ncbi:hypothetical protein HMPREF9373_1033 [Psychrobacter sp. 1501(2011)]|nr:hypothetical protein HMPREF9373_1033 [Psychrobacter sp. 1501(2011)]